MSPLRRIRGQSRDVRLSFLILFFFQLLLQKHAQDGGRIGFNKPRIATYPSLLPPFLFKVRRHSAHYHNRLVDIGLVSGKSTLSYFAITWLMAVTGSEVKRRSCDVTFLFLDIDEGLRRFPPTTASQCAAGAMKKQLEGFSFMSTAQ